MASKQFIYRTVMSMCRENGVSWLDLVQLHEREMLDQIKALEQKLKAEKDRAFGASDTAPVDDLTKLYNEGKIR